MANNWDMPRRGETCTACGHAFEIGETFRAFLSESPTGYERQDFCTTCPPPGMLGVLAAWTTRRPQPATKKAQPFDREAMYKFFQRLRDADEPEKLQFRFVLALLLWRKKVLKFVRSDEAEEVETWEFAETRSGETFHVRRPPLREDQIEQLSEQLEQLLVGAPGEAQVVAGDHAEENADE